MLLAGQVVRRSTFAFGQNRLSKADAGDGVRRVVVMFPGDQLPDSLPPHVLELQDPLVQIEALQRRFPHHTDFLVVFPSEITCEGFSRYGQFLVSSSPTGEPSQYIPQQRKAVSELRRIVDDHCSRIVGPGGKKQGERTLIDIAGFSKGGVVLNQLLVELALFGSSGPEKDEEEEALSDCPLKWAWRSVAAIHYVDVGLNQAGAYMALPEVITALGHSRQKANSSLFVTMLGTWRQWADERRPWVRQEAEQMAELLASSRIPVRWTYIDRGSDGHAGTTAVNASIAGLLAHMKAISLLDPSPPPS